MARDAIIRVYLTANPTLVHVDAACVVVVAAVVVVVAAVVVVVVAAVVWLLTKTMKHDKQNINSDNNLIGNIFTGSSHYWLKRQVSSWK